MACYIVTGKCTTNAVREKSTTQNQQSCTAGNVQKEAMHVDLQNNSKEIINLKNDDCGQPHQRISGIHKNLRK